MNSNIRIHYLTIIMLIGVIFVSVTSMTGSASIVAMNLTIEGAVTDIYDEVEIKNDLPTVSGWGGYQKTTGAIVTASKWKGIHLPLFLSSLLGDVNYNVSFIAIDDYSKSLTRDEVVGGIRAFDDLNNTLTTKVIPVLAYEENDVPVSNDDGPLRLVFIGENNDSILTVSPRWVKQIVTLSITIITDETSSVLSTSASTTTLITDTSTSTSSEDTESFSTTSNSIEFSLLVLVLSVTIITGLRKLKYQK